MPLSRNQLSILASALVLAIAVLPAGAIIDATLQMQLGNPSGATADTNNHDHFLIQRPVEALDYSDHLGQPNWASWDLTSGDLGSSGRSSNFYTDTNLPPDFYRVPGDPTNAFSGSGYDRGHMCPSGDRTTNSTYNDMVFFMSNIIPQASSQNEGIWANFENYCRQTFLPGGKELLIMCGPSLFTTNKLDSNHVTIAGYTWKIVVVVPGGDGAATNRISPTTQVIAVRIPNADAVANDAWQNYRTNVVAIESDTGFTFFTALPPNLATVLRNKVDGQNPPAPAVTGFSPATGQFNTTVTITGTNLVFATNVTLNGTSAAFNIGSTTQIVATVPAGTTSGLIQVQTLGGTATSSNSFIVGSGTTLDMAITATHTGNFTQGDTGDTYTLVVTNTGNATSSGTVTVVDTLPAGLTATAIRGAGWTANLNSLTCMRADPLVPGAAYPPITVTVDVATNALVKITNTASFFGGGDTNLVNNTANDPTTIDAASAPTVATGTATAVGSTTATLNGTVSANGQPATVEFEYGTDTSYGSVAVLAGTVAGTTPRAESAGITGLLSGMTYHFRVVASNAIGAGTGLDQTFTTAAAGAPDFAITTTHSGSFTQGNTADTYTILITNVGTVASSGTVTVTDTLPSGLTATGISGTGWATNLATLTCTRADALAEGAAYPPITIIVSVATNAAANVTNTVTVSGGGDTNLSNNTAIDSTTITPSSGVSLVTLVGWDMSGLPGGANNYGPSPLPPTTNAAGVTIVGLTRGSGVGINNSGAQRGWGGNNWTNTSAALAITSNCFATFSITANIDNKVSYNAISRLDYRHSATGPSNGLLQYQIGAGVFNDIATVAYPTNTGTGASLPPIDLSGIAALQDVGASTNVTFRIVNWGGTSSGGTWYIFDVANSTALDFEVRGTVSPSVATLTPIQLWRFEWFGTIADLGPAADTAIAANGMPNLLSYALGLNPLVPTNNPVVASIDSGYLLLTVPRNPNATDISLHVELTDDLVPSFWSTNGTAVISDTPTLLQVRDDALVVSSDSGFVRLRVSRP